MWQLVREKKNNNNNNNNNNKQQQQNAEFKPVVLRLNINLMWHAEGLNIYKQFIGY